MSKQITMAEVLANPAYLMTADDLAAHAGVALSPRSRHAMQILAGIHSPFMAVVTQADLQAAQVKSVARGSEAEIKNFGPQSKKETIEILSSLGLEPETVITDRPESDFRLNAMLLEAAVKITPEEKTALLDQAAARRHVKDVLASKGGSAVSYGDVLESAIELLPLSIRTYSHARLVGLTTIGDLISKTDNELKELNIHGRKIFTPKSLREIKGIATSLSIVFNGSETTSALTAPALPANPVDAAAAAREKLLEQSVGEWDLTVRTYNVLKNANIKTTRDLTLKTEDELLKIKGLGRRSVAELRDILTTMDLGFKESEVVTFTLSKLNHVSSLLPHTSSTVGDRSLDRQLKMLSSELVEEEGSSYSIEERMKLRVAADLSLARKIRRMAGTNLGANHG